MPKLKMKKGMRVCLKNDHACEGIIVGTLGKVSWTVKWERGRLSTGEPTKQSSKSLTFWTALSAPPPSDEEGDEDEDESDLEERDEGAEEYAAKKARFEAYRKTLVGKTVKVRCAVGPIICVY